MEKTTPLSAYEFKFPWGGKIRTIIVAAGSEDMAIRVAERHAIERLGATGAIPLAMPKYIGGIHNGDVLYCK